MTRAEMARVMERVFAECNAVRGEGQKEYARRDDSAFANFERIAERLGLDRKQVLMVYFEKHVDGVHSHIEGHTSQREDVRGRIKDAITYLCLLRGMIDEDEGETAYVREKSDAGFQSVGTGPSAAVNAKYTDVPDRLGSDD